MIQAVMVISTQAKPRLLKFYNFQPPEKHQDLVRSVFQCMHGWLPHFFPNFVWFMYLELLESLVSVLSARPDGVSNFVKVDSIFGPGTKMVYKHLATLYFVFVFDSSENELAMLDLIQVFVETLDRCFKNVCELDIVFNFNKLHSILDEMILGGQVIETSSEQIMKSVEEIARLEKQSSTTSLIPKSISERFSR
ncbi:AP-3 complex subunit sigma-like isoform X1 [Panicum virgatum]|uniref:AP-3 complex subunit sigma-like isoform X1 n=1 Tax=Panicum virgatum TaxID=38727 RepID=UPI0019D59F14|nr:AP-3 complex subunit sigma-like isoform X1 [Panicum virgatum]